MPDRHLLDLLTLLHTAPGNADGWFRFLDALRDAISPDTVVLFAAEECEDQPGLLAGSGLGVFPTKRGDLPGPSFPHPIAAEFPLGAVRELPAPPTRFSEAKIFRERLGPAGVLPGPGFVVVTDRNRQQLRAVTLVLPTSPGWKPTVADRALLEHLAPHLVIARRMHLRLLQRRRDAEALRSAFDRLALGVVVVDNRERVSYANRSAAELLGGPPGFTSPATLAAEAPDGRSLCFQRLRPEAVEPKRGAFVATHPEDGHALHVLATELRWGDRRNEAARFARAFFIGDSRVGSGTPLRVLRETFDLTPGQGRIAVLLASGHSIEQAASMLEISVHTARSVLKQVFEKTGTNRQAALVHLLLSTFGQVLAPAEPEPPRSAPHRARRPTGAA